MTIAQFWDMTPYELSLVMEAYGERQEKQLYLTAWQTAHHLNMVSKKRITAEKLLGRRRSSELAPTKTSVSDYASPEAFRAALRASKHDAPKRLGTGGNVLSAASYASPEEFKEALKSARSNDGS